MIARLYALTCERRILSATAIVTAGDYYVQVIVDENDIDVMYV
jgi:hypothetical protein